MEPKTGKRIVSKGDYVKVRTGQAGAYLAGYCLLLLCCLFGLIAAVSGPISMLGAVDRVFYLSSEDSFEIWQIGGYYFLFILSIAGIYFLGKASKASLKYAGAMDAYIPLTRANTADLPAPDSLVRASSEPLQAQEAVLLRAAAERQERH